MESMDGFKVGDRVEWNGKLGTVKCFSPSSFAGVEFDKNIDGHDLGGRVKHGYGYWCHFKYLTKVEEKQTIVIKREGDTITAYMGKRQAVAKCSSKDEFDLYKGAILALTRLLIEEE